MTIQKAQEFESESQLSSDTFIPCMEQTQAEKMTSLQKVSLIYRLYSI